MKRELRMKNLFLWKSLKIGTAFVFLGITGCAEYQRQVLLHTDEKGTDFTKTLAKEYETLGNTEQHIMYDDVSADYYYRKAICAKSGNLVGPTPLEKWDLPADKICELSTARERLIRALNSGARDIAPKMTAYTQAHFDCWVEQQAERWQKDDIGLCRSEYYGGISEVELMFMGGIDKVLPEHVVYFDFNTSHIQREGMKVIDAVAAKATSKDHPSHILLVGRTDKIGDAKHNKNLSKHRALAVKKELIRRGVDPHLMSLKGAGETPGPNVDSHNRRVDILFLNY